MQRKEAYSTSGSRILVRFFGGFDFVPGDAHSRTPAEAGYAKGVPMGGDLQAAPKGKSATFLVAALKDPFGGNLDRIQIIKGWVDQPRPDRRRRSSTWSGAMPTGANRGPTASCRRSATRSTSRMPIWTNTIGDPELITVWIDPEFDPAQARVLLRARHRDPDAALDRL